MITNHRTAMHITLPPADVVHEGSDLVYHVNLEGLGPLVEYYKCAVGNNGYVVAPDDATVASVRKCVRLAIAYRLARISLVLGEDVDEHLGKFDLSPADKAFIVCAARESDWMSGYRYWYSDTEDKVRTTAFAEQDNLLRFAREGGWIES